MVAADQGRDPGVRRVDLVKRNKRRQRSGGAEIKEVRSSIRAYDAGAMATLIESLAELLIWIVIGVPGVKSKRTLLRTPGQSF
jgi:hypothetical protein